MPQLIKEGCRLGTKNTSKARDRLISCNKCDPFAVTPFKRLLDESAGSEGSTEAVLPEPAKCPSCFNIVSEDTLVAFRNDMDSPEVSAVGDYFDPPLEDMTIELVGENLRAAAQSMISGCDQCCDCPEITFECILDELTGCDPKSTEYILCRPARCPRCRRDVTERTIVLPRQ
jgi:hypothetical protein